MEAGPRRHRVARSFGPRAFRHGQRLAARLDRGTVLRARRPRARREVDPTPARIVIVPDPVAPTLVGPIIPPTAKWVAGVNESEYGWMQNIADRAMERPTSAELIVSTSITSGDPKRVPLGEAGACFGFAPV